MTVDKRNKLGAKRSKAKYRILEALADKDYNPQRVADELGVRPPAISKVLNGHGHSPRILKKLREVGVPEEYLFDPQYIEKEVA